MPKELFTWSPIDGLGQWELKVAGRAVGRVCQMDGDFVCYLFEEYCGGMKTEFADAKAQVEKDFLVWFNGVVSMARNRGR